MKKTTIESLVSAICLTIIATFLIMDVIYKVPMFVTLLTLGAFIKTFKMSI